MVIHLQDALQNGSTTCLVRTVDTDVIVILIGKFNILKNICPAADIWVAFGVGKRFTYIPINTIAEALGEDKCVALPAFHSFTGCDTVSSFYGKGKKKAWEAWKCYPKVTDAFQLMAKRPYTYLNIETEHFKVLERFTVVLYDKTSSMETVNETRRDMFCQKSKSMDAIPPTQDALLQHAKRASYQTGIWATCDQPQQQAPSPENWGWMLDKESRSWTPVWTTLPVASKACRELVKCSCKTDSGCSRCSCGKVGLECTQLCTCKCKK